MSPNNDFSNADGYFLSLETVTLFLIAADKVEAINSLIERMVCNKLYRLLYVFAVLIFY